MAQFGKKGGDRQKGGGGGDDLKRGGDNKPLPNYVSITRKPRLYVAMFHASLHSLLHVKWGQ